MPHVPRHEMTTPIHAFEPTRSAGLARLQAFLPHAGRDYAELRNHDTGSGWPHVSCLSPWLHAGLLSEREVIEAALDAHGMRGAEKFISEVFWRVYFKGYLEQRPDTWGAYLSQRDAALAEVDASSGLAKAYAEATEGRTGIAAFDTWARELVEHGYLHNHARMWFASIWIFTLKLDWTLGADFFLRHLMCGDAASNTLSWRWVAGLHTKGKAYPARAGNITRYTGKREDGPLEASGLAEDIEALSEDDPPARKPLDLPEPPQTSDFDQPFALLLHDEAAHAATLDLSESPALVITAARPDARSPGVTGDPARDFALGAVRSGAKEAGETYGCPVREWDHEASLESMLGEAGIKRLALPYLPVGWPRDALWPELELLENDGRLITLLPDLSRATWPYAKAGFFGVKKKMESVLGEIGLPA